MGNIVIGKKTLKEIDKMKGLDFEVFVGELLTQHGYKTQNIKGSGDFGVDVIAEKNGTKYAVQVKRYTSNVSRTAISDAVAGKFHWDCEKAWVVTNSYFTSDAKLLATSTACKLTDRDDLKRMMQDGSTFASIFEGGQKSPRKSPRKSKGRSIWATLLLIGIAALGFYAIRFIPQEPIDQLWQNTTSMISSTLKTSAANITSALETPSMLGTPSTPSTPDTPLTPTPTSTTPAIVTEPTLPDGFAPTVPTGLRPVTPASELIPASELTPTNILTDENTIMLDSGDSLSPTPVISTRPPIGPITDLDTQEAATTELEPAQSDNSDTSE